MDIEAAYRMLGLTTDASEADIDARYRALARQYHPDSGGDEPLMRELNKARDLAKAAAVSAVVPMAVVSDLISSAVSAVEQRLRVREDAQDAALHAKSRSTFGLRQARRFSLLMGIYAAIFLFIGKDLPNDTLSSIFGALAGREFARLAFWFGTIAATLGGVTTIFIRRIEWRVEDLTRYLSSRAAVSELWFEIVSPTNSWFTRSELEERVAAWSDFLNPADTHRTFRSTVRRMGSAEFVHLFVAKGRETDAMQRQQVPQEGRVIERYTLSIGANEASAA